MESKSHYGWTPLSRATGNEHEAVVRLLAEKGADVESKGHKPWAAWNGHEVGMKPLLEKGADVESKDRLGGRTPLSWAAAKGYEAAVKLLLEKGADVEPKDGVGQTSLSRAARDGHKAVVKLLLEKSAEKLLHYNGSPINVSLSSSLPRCASLPSPLPALRRISSISSQYTVSRDPQEIERSPFRCQRSRSQNRWLVGEWGRGKNVRYGQRVETRNCKRLWRKTI
jgi:hypothetical protein